MGVDRFFVHDVTILSPTVTEGRWGDETTGYTDGDTVRGWVAVRNNSVDPAAPNRDVDVSQWVAMLPADCGLNERDRLSVALHGRTYLFDVISHVIPGSTPDGLHHVEANLRLVEG